VQYDPFFWDTVQLASKHAHHFYENDLQWTLLPPEIDSGHAPVFGYYLALVWAFFGKTLPASHWAMLPFLLLNIWLLYRLGLRLGGPKWAFWLIPLVLIDPVMAGQSVLVSPDIVLICGFLCAVEGLFGKNKLFTAVGILILCAVSMRGMMTAAALYVWQLLTWFQISGLSWAQNLKPQISRFFGFAIQSVLPFLPGFVFAASFLWWHLEAAGWIGYHPDSPWAPTFEPATGVEMLRNVIVLGWRWLDVGRVFEWAVLGWLIWKNWPLRRNAPNYKKLENLTGLALLLICLVIFLSPSTLLLKNVSAHRYFLPGFVALHLLVFQWLAQANLKIGQRKILAPALLIVALASGNLWIYPRGIAMGWDASLVHLPYHHLRVQAVAFLDKEKIDFQTVGSAFPNLNTGENLLLNGDYRRFADKNFVQNEYIFASNVFNDISEPDYDTLRQNWALKKRWEQAGVWIEIYRRKP